MTNPALAPSLLQPSREKTKITFYEKQCVKKQWVPKKDFCPRIAAIKHLKEIIRSLQTCNHAIILMIDANQSHDDCFTKFPTVKPFSIKWLRVQCGMDDPFVQLVGRRPNSTTQTPNRNIDFILVWHKGVQYINLTTQLSSHIRPSGNYNWSRLGHIFLLFIFVPTNFSLPQPYLRQ